MSFPQSTKLVDLLQALQRDIRTSLRSYMVAQTTEVLARAARTDGPGDTIYGIDAEVEQVLLARCHEWGQDMSFLLLAEGLDPTGLAFGTGSPAFRLLVDPIDGTRGLMYDKRSAWCLMAAAPDRGDDTMLSDVEVAVMTELPTTRQATSDCLWAVRGHGSHGSREHLETGTTRPLELNPSSAVDLAHGFATVNDFSRVGRALNARVAERVLDEVLGSDSDGLDCFPDQYICCAGQLAELTLGRDRFVLDVRPWVYEHLGVENGRANHPYDVCTLLIARQAGVVVLDPTTGKDVDAPFGIEPTLGFAAYANDALAHTIQPVVERVIQRILGTP